MTTELLTKLDELTKAVADRRSEWLAVQMAVQEAQQALNDFVAANGEALESWRKLLGVQEPRPKRKTRSDKDKPRGPRAEAAA